MSYRVSLLVLSKKACWGSGKKRVFNRVRKEICQNQNFKHLLSQEKINLFRSKQSSYDASLKGVSHGRSKSSIVTQTAFCLFEVVANRAKSTDTITDNYRCLKQTCRNFSLNF